MAGINRYVPKDTYAVVAGYRGDELVAVIAGAVIEDDDRLRLRFPKANPFAVGQKVTIHLDDRTGVEEFTPEIKVHRCSYKGRVLAADGTAAEIGPEEFVLRYSSRTLLDFKASGYAFPEDGRTDVPIGATVLSAAEAPNPDEQENKLGVWITRAKERPHTTVMAFLSSKKDDIFLISHRGTFKSQLIHRDPRCLFAIDHRSTYRFEKAIDWNYSIIRGTAAAIPRGTTLFDAVQNLFIEKNPWELMFFSDPKVEMFHIVPEEILCPEKYAGH
jgi:hypothetical protein